MPKINPIDATDRKLIRALQKNGRMTNLDLAAEINLSPSPCLRRLRNLEQSGAIKSYGIEVDAAAYGLPVTVFVRVTLEKHTDKIVKKFEDDIHDIPEVLECYMLTGLSDYLLRVVVADLEDYERFIRHRLHRVSGVSSIDSNLVYSVVKRTPVFPEL